jgi:serine/threonine-protein kinase
MPPEQAEGDLEKVDERADVFALGSILCELLTGSPAYTGRDLDEVRHKAMRGDLAEARERLDTCGAEPDLVSLAKQCLAAELHDRLNDAGMVAGRIAAHINAVEERLEAAKLARVAAETKAAEERKRRRLEVASMATGLLLVSIAGTAAGFWLHERNAREEEARARADNVRLEVDKALRASMTLIMRGWSGTEDHKLWQTTVDQAHSELDRAERFLALGPVDAALRDQVQYVRKELERENDVVRMADDVDKGIQGVLEAGVTTEAKQKAAAQVHSIFLKRGVNILDPSTKKQTVEWLRTHPASMQLRVLLAVWYGWTPITEVGTKSCLSGILNALDPNLTAIYSRWVIAVAMHDGPTLAKLADDPAVAALPPFGKVLIGIGLFSNRAGDEAVQFLQRWQSHHPDDFWLSFHLGIALLRRNRAKEALRYLTAAVSIRKADWRGYTYLGVAYRLDEDWDKAIAAYGRAIELDRNAAPPHRYLAKLLQAQGKEADAQDLLRKARELTTPGLSELKRVDGWIDTALSRYARDVRPPPAARP